MPRPQADGGASACRYRLPVVGWLDQRGCWEN